MEMLRVAGVTSVGLLAITAMFARSAAAASVNDFVDYSLRDESNMVLLPGRLHVPAAYASDPTTPRPLILFLHGGGEVGTDNLLQINGNIDRLLLFGGKARGAFLYAPQTRTGWYQENELANTMAMIDRAIAEWNVDPTRIYVTGLSLGGGGVWNYLSTFSERFAAGVPICAIGPSVLFPPAIVAHEPIWAFHARNDNIVPPTSSREIIDVLLGTEGQPQPNYPALNDFTSDFQFDSTVLDIHYSEYRTGGHGIWSRVYSTAAMYDWLFAQRSVPEPSSCTMILLGLVAPLLCRRANRDCLHATH
jgi:predicted peptidase